MTLAKRMRPHLWAKVWDWIWAKVGAEKEAQEGSVLIAAIRLSPTQCWDADSTACCQDLSKLTKSLAISLLDQTYSACGLLDEKDEMNWRSHCTGWLMFGSNTKLRHWKGTKKELFRFYWCHSGGSGYKVWKVRKKYVFTAGLVWYDHGDNNVWYKVIRKWKLQLGKVKSLMVVWSSSFQFQNEVKLQQNVVGGKFGKSGSWSVFLWTFQILYPLPPEWHQ